MITTAQQRSRWAIQSDCYTRPHVEDLEHARYLLTTHAGHGGRCHTYLAALRYASCVVG